MNPQEKSIRYLDLAMPQAGTVTPITPDVSWIRMPLPFALDHINLWLLTDSMEGKDGWTIIDTGVATDATQAAWREIVKSQLNGKPLLRVLCTHFHPDHVGLAAWLCKGMGENRWHAPLWMNYAEYAAARIWSNPAASNPSDDAPDAVNMAAHFHRHGISDPEMLEKLKLRRNHYPSLVPEVPTSFRRIMPEEEISIGKSPWRVIAGYGHSPEHCALFNKEKNLLISGDMVLPRISTNMSVWAQEPDADPLRLYLESLDAFEILPDDVTVLPSHGKPFGAQRGESAGGLKVRLKQLKDHHQERLSETFDACAKPVSAAQVLPILFKRELDLHQLTFALGETIAHLNYLWHRGEIKRSEDAKGLIYFSQA